MLSCARLPIAYVFGGLALAWFPAAGGTACPQASIPVIDAFPDVPSPLVMLDWRQRALDFQFSIAFDATAQGPMLPLLWWDDTHTNWNSTGFGMPAYVGSPEETCCGSSHQLLTCGGAVLSGGLVGLDMRRRTGPGYEDVDFVAMLQDYFNIASKQFVFLNNPYNRAGSDWWYDVFPGVIMTSISHFFPDTGQIEDQLLTTCDRWYNACVVMGGTNETFPNFNHSAFSFDQNKPVDNGQFIEPDAAAGIAFIEYLAYKKWGNARHLQAADWGLQFLSTWSASPLYECLLPFGVYTAARMNAELNRQYDVVKMFTWLTENSDPSVRSGWGMISDVWDGTDVYGLIGSATDNGGYAFAMNTFETAGILASVPRYHKGLARAIGKLLLHMANAARLFFGDQLPADHQSSAGWNGDPLHSIAYEGLRKSCDGIAACCEADSLCATGDAMRGTPPAGTDFGVYGGAHVGALGAVIGLTNDTAILQIDTLAYNPFAEPAYPTYLVYNPYPNVTAIELTLDSFPVDLYDLISAEYLAKGAERIGVVAVAGYTAAVVVCIPSGIQIEQQGNRLVAGGVVVDYTATCNEPDE